MKKKIDKKLRYHVIGSNGKVIATYKTRNAAKSKILGIYEISVASTAHVLDTTTNKTFTF